MDDIREVLKAVLAMMLYDGIKKAIEILTNTKDK